MFKSATLKLTGWYLLILMVTSLLFSAAIYQLASNEVNQGLERFGSRLEAGPNNAFFPDDTVRQIQDTQAHQASSNLLTGLFYMNLLILIMGGLGCFALARRTIRPLEEIHEAQSRFTSDASHELRTPLAVMKAELELGLRDKAISKSDMREILESNLEEVDKLTRLSQMLLQLSKLEYDSIERSEFSFDESVWSVARRFDKKGKRIIVQPAKKPLYVDGSQPSIEELITILLDNALKYSPPESVVSVHLDKKGGYARLSVTNEGDGISEEDLPHIFDRFFRADTSRTNSSEKGYGLGLSLAKKIVELHNGELSATSGVNNPTTLTVLLPIIRKNKVNSQ